MVCITAYCDMKCPFSDAARTVLRIPRGTGMSELWLQPRSAAQRVAPQRREVDSVVPVIGQLNFRSRALNSYLSHLLETGRSGNFTQCALPLPTAL